MNTSIHTPFTSQTQSASRHAQLISQKFNFFGAARLSYLDEDERVEDWSGDTMGIARSCSRARWQTHQVLTRSRVCVVVHHS